MAVYGSRATNVAQRRFGCLLAFCSTTTAVIQRTSCRDDSVVCWLSAVPLRPSCSERSAETLLRSAVILWFWLTVAVVATVFATAVLSRVLASPSRFDIRCAFRLLSVNFSHFTLYVDTSTYSLKIIPYMWLTHTCTSSDIRAHTLEYMTLLCPLYFHPDLPACRDASHLYPVSFYTPCF